MGDHGLKNRPNLLRLTELVKDLFDDAPDAGTGRKTRFIFASEVEAERRKAGQLLPAAEGKAPDAAPGPLAGLEELEEPGG